LSECAEGTTPGANRYSPEKAQKVLNYLKNEQKIDFIVASVQFRERDTYEPRTEQVQISKTLVDFGADVVYGSQAHQVQQVEHYKNKVIYYGLGNFLFDQNYSLGVRQGFFLQHFFHNGQLIQSIPVYTMLREARPDIATESEATEIKNAILRDDLIYK
jgi:poly-gamma-glutamate capsule biosynthesis protein CapA/YwtB (metallophosphatase superfamily)